MMDMQLPKLTDEIIGEVIFDMKKIAAHFNVTGLLRFDSDDEFDMPIASFSQDTRMPFPLTRMSYSTKRISPAVEKMPLLHGLESVETVLLDLGDMKEQTAWHDFSHTVADRNPELGEAPIITGWFYGMCRQNGQLGMLIFGQMGYLLQQNRWVSWSSDSVRQWAKTLGATEDLVMELSSGVAEWLFHPFWYTVEMLNCGNVTTERVLPTRQQRRIYERRGESIPNEHRIVVKVPGKGTHTLAGPRRPGEAQIPAHMVRGHFAEYTEERPLFGKYAGRFWIPAHVRGIGDAQPREYVVKPRSESGV